MHKVGTSMSTPNTTFTLFLKVANKQISVPVFETDTHDTLAQRVCDSRVFSQQQKKIAKAKILHSLQSLIASGGVSESLQRKVHKFLAQIAPQTGQGSKNSRSKHASPTLNEGSCRSKTRSKGSDKDRKLEKKQTPFRLIDSNETSWQSKNRHCRPDSRCAGRGKREIHGHGTGKNQTKGILIKNKNRTAQQDNQGRAAVDPDLIKAYQTIYRKSHEASIKGMAGQFLSKLGSHANQHAGSSQCQQQQSRRDQECTSRQENSSSNFKLDKIESLLNPLELSYPRDKQWSTEKYHMRQYEDSTLNLSTRLGVNQHASNRKKYEYLNTTLQDPSKQTQLYLGNQLAETALLMGHLYKGQRSNSAICGVMSRSRSSRRACEEPVKVGHKRYSYLG